MIRKTNLFRTAAVSLLLATSAQATELFNLADLKDGETRVFGDAAKSLTATRTGDAGSMVLVAPDKPTREEACDLAAEVCRVGVEEHGDGLKIMLMKTIEHLEGEGELARLAEIHTLNPGERIHVGHVEAWTEADGSDLEAVDLKDLADGETRAFGPAGHTLTASRNGDLVWLTQAGTAEAGTPTQCNLTTESCTVTVVKHGDDGPTKVKLVKRGGDGAEADEDVIIHATPGDEDGAVTIKRIEDGNGNVRIEKRVRKVVDKK